MFGLYEDEKNDDPYNPNDGSLYVNPFRSGDKSAQETLSDLYESEFQDYLNRFFPVEQDLIEQMTTGFEGLQQEETVCGGKTILYFTRAATKKKVWLWFGSKSKQTG